MSANTARGSVAATPAAAAVSASGQALQLYRLWALIGVFFLSLEAWTLVQWVSSPYFKPAPVGPDPIPTDALLHVRIIEAVSLTGFLICLWLFIVRPLLQHRPLSAYARIFIAMITCYWMDPLYNYTNAVWYYNAYAINMGSWASFIPGWISPAHENFPEPLLAAGCLWFLAFGPTAKGGAWLYGKAREWFGADALIRPLLLIFVVSALFDFAFENVWIRMDVFGFQGTWAPLTLWAGTEYQFPLYEPPMEALLMTPIILLAYYRDDHGFMFCERGLHKLNVSGRMRTLLAIIATCGFAQFVCAFVWMMPFQWFGTHITSNASLPSYKLGGMCGKGTAYACPDGSFGVPTQYVKPKFVVHPDDPRLK